jgi:hypothetical protein
MEEKERSGGEWSIENIERKKGRIRKRYERRNKIWRRIEKRKKRSEWGRRYRGELRKEGKELSGGRRYG